MSPDLEQLEAELAALDEEENFDEENAIIAEAEAEALRRQRIKALRNSVSNTNPLSRVAVEKEIRELEEGFVWTTTAAVALFHTQVCATCDSAHSFFVGWMTEQKHRTDPHARRLVKGRPVENLPERVECHPQGAAEICANCAESIVAIDRATGRCS